MENATQALLIAAGILLTIMVVTVLVLGWNSISDFFQAKNENMKIMQLTEFNKQFENYANEDVRGSDLLSLIGKVQDYNTKQTVVDGQEYEQMRVMITIGNLSNFKYSNDSSWNFPSTITQNTISEILEKIAYLESKYGSTSEVSKLSANITKFDISNKDKNFEDKLEEINKILNTVTVDKSNYKTIRDDALIAYQITQFKRAHFKCIDTKYNEETARIVSMTFKFTGEFQ